MANKEVPYSAERWREPPGAVDTQCSLCRHHAGWGKCKAFPDGIPYEIRVDKVPHKEPYPGDNGIQFEPKDE